MRELSPWRMQRLPQEADTEYSYHPEPEEPHLRYYWKILLKHRRLVALVFLVVFGLGAYLTFSATPLYTASATLKIEPQDTIIVQLQEQLLATQSGGNPAYDYYQTQFALLKSRPLAARVITELGLESDPNLAAGIPGPLGQLRSWLRTLASPVLAYVSNLLGWQAEESPPSEFEYGVDPGLIYNYLNDFLTVDPQKNTRLVQVTFTTPDPHLSQKLANAHVVTFIRTALETRFELSKEAREFLEKKLAELTAKTQRAEEELQRFRQAHGVVSLEGSENVVIDRLVDLNKRLTEAKAKRIEQESLYRTVANKNSRYLSDIIDNQVVQQLKTGLLALEAEQARLSATFTPDHPRLAELREQIREARRRLDREIDNVARKIESDYGAARAKEEAMQAEADRQQQTALNLKEVGAEYAVFQAEVDSNKALRDNVLKRLKETTVSKDAPVSNLQISERAEIPLVPSSPQIPRNLLVAAAGGLFLGAGLSFFLEYMDSTVRTPEDVWRAVSIPTLGMVPHLSSLRRWGYGYGHLPTHSSVNGLAHPVAVPGHSFPQELTLAHHPLSIIAESYRTIRTALLLSQAEQPPQVLLFTSAHPADGKTVTTLNLGIALAQGGRTVIVIDGDLRKGCCHTLLRRQNNRGLSNVLTGSLTLEEGVQITPVAGLSFLSRGTIPPNPGELLGSRKMREVLQVLRERFDFVLIDSPPTIAVSDAAVLSQLCDGVVLVLRGQTTTTEAARRAVERLEMAHARILGVVLNGIDIRDPDYVDYRQYYSSYAAAQQDAEELA